MLSSLDANAVISRVEGVFPSDNFPSTASTSGSKLQNSAAVLSTTNKRKPVDPSLSGADKTFAEALNNQDLQQTLAAVLAFGIQKYNEETSQTEQNSNQVVAVNKNLLLLESHLLGMVEKRKQHDYVAFVSEVGNFLCKRLRKNFPTAAGAAATTKNHAPTSSSSGDGNWADSTTASTSDDDDRDRYFEQLAEFYRQEVRKLPNQASDLPVMVQFQTLLITELLFLYRKLQKEDLSRFVLENFFHPFKRIQQLPSKSTREELVKAGFLVEEESITNQLESKLALSYLNPKISYPFAVEYARVLLSQGKLAECVRKLEYAIQFVVLAAQSGKSSSGGGETNTGNVSQEQPEEVDNDPTTTSSAEKIHEAAVSSTMQRQLRILLRMYVPVRLVCGRNFQPDDVRSDLIGAEITATGTQDDQAEIRTTPNITNGGDRGPDFFYKKALTELTDGDFYEILKDKYENLSIAINSGNLQLFETEFAKHRQFYFDQKCDVQILQKGKRRCWFNLIRSVYYLIRRNKQMEKIQAEETPEKEILTIANKKGISLEVFIHCFQKYDPKMAAFEEDVAAAIVELCSIKALRCYGSWNKFGLVFDEKKPFDQRPLL
ncbi:unnamed protein product [Amoebophrya sp. A120]|nr:unnamed protein product [Amoebophrya sp. A120]|eukprot:GSA120T00007155001.1